MMVIAELLSNFFPRRPARFREHVLSCLFTIVLSVLVWMAVARFYGMRTETVVQVPCVLAAFETVAYAASRLMFRRRAGGDAET